MENWRDIPGWEGYYQVSNYGRVASLARVITRANGSPYKVREKILRPGKKEYGHLIVSLCREHTNEMHRVSRLVLRAFVGEPPSGLEARHLNGIASDDHIDNLCWGTSLENSADTKLHGKINRGQRNGRSVLSETEALAIRDALGLHKDIAKQYDVSRRTVGDIKLRKSWKHLP